MKERQPVRSPDNTSLTISLSKQLKQRIETAADEDRRKVSPWCVIQLEKILDELEANQEAPILRVAEEAGNESSPSTPASFAPVKYPKGKRRKKA